MTATTRPGTYRAALGVPEFDAIAGSSLVSIVGDGAAYLAATVLVYQRTGSSLLSALTFAVAFLPYLFGGTLLAALVDRLRPKALLIGFDLIGAGLVAVTAIPGVPILALFAVLFVIGSLAPVRSGTAGALVAEILPGDTFLAGRSVLRICAQSGQIAGTAIGGALVAGFGPRGAMLADTASFVFSAALTTVFVRPRNAPGGAAGRSLIADSLAGIRDVWAQPAVRRLLLLGWIVPFIAVAPEGLAAPAVAQAGHRAAFVGLWLAAIPVGTVLGDVLTVWTVPVRYRVRLTWPLALALTALLVLFAFRPPFVASIALLTATGAASAYGLGLDQALRDTTPAALMGRMYTLNSTGLMVFQGLGFAAGGALGLVVSAYDAIALAGAVGVVAVLILGRRARTRRRRSASP